MSFYIFVTMYTMILNRESGASSSVSGDESEVSAESSEDAVDGNLQLILHLEYFLFCVGFLAFSVIP